MQIFLGKIALILTISSIYLSAYSFDMHIDKKDPMIGEKCTLFLDFNYTNLEEYEIEEPDFENFDISLLKDKESKDKNGIWHVHQMYKLVPYKSGSMKIPSLKTHIEMIEEKYQDRYNKSKYLKKFDIFTKPIIMDIKPLPEGITITGDYQLYAKIDKNSTKEGKPIHFTVTIEGEGNIPNLDFLTLDIPETTIYEKLDKEYEKSFDIISNKDFTILPIVLKYYNQKTNQVTFLKSDLFDIKVIGKIPKRSYFDISWWFLSPVLLFLIPLLFWYFNDEKKGLKKQLKSCKDKESLLKKLIPFLHKNRQLTRQIYQLENVDKKKLKKLKKEILRHF